VINAAPAGGARPGGSRLGGRLGLLFGDHDRGFIICREPSKVRSRFDYPGTCRSLGFTVLCSSAMTMPVISWQLCRARGAPGGGLSGAVLHCGPRPARTSPLPIFTSPIRNTRSQGIINFVEHADRNRAPRKRAPSGFFLNRFPSFVERLAADKRSPLVAQGWAEGEDVLFSLALADAGISIESKLVGGRPVGGRSILAPRTIRPSWSLRTPQDGRTRRPPGPVFFLVRAFEAVIWRIDEWRGWRTGPLSSTEL